MSVIETIKKLDENKKLQALTEKEIENLKEKIKQEQRKQCYLQSEEQKIKRTPVKVKFSDVLNQIKKEWKTEDVDVLCNTVVVRAPIRDANGRISYSKSDICSRPSGKHLTFEFVSPSMGKRTTITQVINPNSIQANGRHLSEMFDVVGVIDDDVNYFSFVLQLPQRNWQYFMFNDSIDKYKSGSGHYVLDAIIANEEKEDEKERI